MEGKIGRGDEDSEWTDVEMKVEEKVKAESQAGEEAYLSKGNGPAQMAQDKESKTSLQCC